MYPEVYTAVGNDRRPEEDQQREVFQFFTKERDQENGDGEMVGGMGRNEAVLSPAFIPDDMDKTWQGRFMTGTKPLEDILEKVDGGLVAQEHKYGHEQKDDDRLFFVVPDNEIDQHHIQGDPYQFVAQPVHYRVPERTIPAVDQEKQVFVELFYSFDHQIVKLSNC